MANRLCFFWGLTLTLIGACACEKVANIEKKTLVPVTTPPQCSALLSTTGFGLRVANLITTDTKLDVCLRPAGGQYPSVPLLRSGATGCPDGIGYGQYTMPLKVDAGTYDVKLVPAGSGCDADGPTAVSVVVDSEQSTSVMAYGSAVSSSAAYAKALQDATDVSNNVYVRFFHAENNQGPVDVSVVKLPIFENVQFGNIASQASLPPFSVDDLGYMIYPNSGNDPGSLPMAATDAGTTNTLLSMSVYLTKGHHYNLFLIGAATDTSFKPRLWSCDEGVASPNAMLAECGDPRDLNVSIFHPNLTDRFTDYVTERKDKVFENIASSTADVLCLPELYPPEIRQAVGEHLPQNTTVTFSDTFPVSPKSNLNDENNQPVTWTDPACSGDYATAIAGMRDCLSALPCATAAGGEDASVEEHYFSVEGSEAIGCVSGTYPGSNGGCVLALYPFVNNPSHAGDQCLMCAISELSSGHSFEHMYTACASSTGGTPHYVYDGATGLALISKLSTVAGESPEVIGLPSSSWYRAALRVPLTLGNNAVVDFWCADIRAPNSETFIRNGGPYYGSAAAGDAEAGNTAEEKLQIERLIAAVNQQAADSGRRAVVLALTYASPAIINDQGQELVSSQAPDNYALFQQTTWQELVAPSWTPACTWCKVSENPLNGIHDNQAVVHMFGVGIGSDAVTETLRTYTSNVISMNLYDGTPVLAPISQYYGLQSTVRVTQ